MRYWWVNQSKRFYEQEVGGGFLWSPKAKSNGGDHYYYSTMSEVEEGDVVFSYSDTAIRAIGVAQRRAVTQPKPFAESTHENWSKVGWFVEVEYVELVKPLHPRDWMELIGPLLPTKYSPIQQNGRGQQGAYLAGISNELGLLLLQLSGENLNQLVSEHVPLPPSEAEQDTDMEVRFRQLEGDPEKIALVKARRGQGVFKSNLRLIEKSCRITGVDNIRHLRASHIKPWKDSTDEEKLDGCNGLLLSPHVDHLFDGGYVSFSNSGDLIVSPKLELVTLDRWSISKRVNVGSFNAAQRGYLEFHRDEVLKTS